MALLIGRNLWVPAKSRSVSGSIYVRFGIKRALDLICLLPLFVCFLIALSVIVVLTPLLNPGPIFYVQERLGRHGRLFRMYKFRSIQADGSIPVAAQFMRKTRVDELPQILNVLLGDMSLIGPRPERPELVAYYHGKIPNYSTRLAVRPGISGLAQLHQGYADDVEGTRRKLRWDLTYIQSQSLALDLQIFLKTARVIFAHLLRVRIDTPLG